MSEVWIEGYVVVADRDDDTELGAILDKLRDAGLIIKTVEDV